MIPRIRSLVSIAFTLSVLILAATAHAAAFTPPPFMLAWGSAGSGPGQFQFSHGLAVSSSGIVYVSDFLNARVQRFSMNGDYLGEWSAPDPAGVFVDASGFVYLAGGHTVRKYTATGSLVTSWGSQGGGDGQFEYSQGITVRDGFVYVTDWMNHRIQKFTDTGAFVAKWGSGGTGPGQFAGITWIVAGDDVLYVCDSDNDRVQRFDTNGVYLGQWGSRGAAPGQMYFPTNPALDADGFLYVPESGNQRIQVFRPDGSHVGMWGSAGSGPSQFNDPTAVAIGPDGTVFVDDKDNSRIQRFGPLATPARGVTWGALKARYR